jgi:D-alanyl-D-alanine carboxypeptidase/D-alanyl-D-alanine-endopeptidase (penicillin-binding protein 4)
MMRALVLSLLLVTGVAGAQEQALPTEVRQALQRAGVPDNALAVVVQELGAPAPRLQSQADASLNPASLFKLVTTAVALDLLGPAYTWRTPVWLNGEVHDGVLEGSLVIQGSGDPSLVLERVWLLLRRVRQLGVREIRGDIVLDRSLFAPSTAAPADFDNEPLKPYNVQPDALLLNYKSVLLTFTPDPAHRVARISADPPLAGATVDAAVPLSDGPCTDGWRTSLKATFDADSARFGGRYPAACGERQWPLAWPDPQHYNARLIEALWRESGGVLRGQVHDGSAPSAVAPSFVVESPPLAEVVRDINKFSNNLMAQQLFLTLGATLGGSGTPQAARQVLVQWLEQRAGGWAAKATLVDNGAGLSREQRTSARVLAQLLQLVYASPVMPELLGSLPISGIDGTARRMQGAPGRAHLKTGSLRDVAGIAGVVLAASGRRYVLVAVINHPNANEARPALDALLRWTWADQ